MSASGLLGQPNDEALRILVVGLNYAPDMVGIPKYTTEMAEWLAAKGHHVAVVTAPPYYPSWQIDEAYRSKLYSREYRNGVAVTRCPLYVPANPTGLNRILHLLSFAIASIPCALWRGAIDKPDVVISIAPTLLSSLGAHLAATLSGGKSWLHLQDFEVDAAFGLGLMSGSRLRSLATWIESVIFHSFNRVSTISPQMMRRLLSKGCDQRRIYEFRNWVDIEQIVPWEGANRFRADLGIAPEDILVLYSGSVARKQGLDIVVEAARALVGNLRIKFVICGDGPGKADLCNSARDLKNVQFTSLQPIERLGEVLGAADIHLLPQLANAADLVLPSKLTGMLASGRPVIATAEPESGIAQEVVGCGVVVPASNIAAFVSAIEMLSDDPALRIGLGNAARIRAETVWSKENILSALEAELFECSGRLSK